MGARQQFAEVLHANYQRNRQPNGAPQRVAPADPLPKHQLVVRGNPPLAHLVRAGGYTNKVLAHNQLCADRFGMGADFWQVGVLCKPPD